MRQYSQENTCWTLFLVKLQAFRPANLLKSGSNTGLFSVNVANFSRTAFSIAHLRWLLLFLLEKERGKRAKR